jgi:hypothetical protein
MSSVTVQCPTCSLRLVETDHPDVVYARDGNDNILCPNDGTPMKPIGERQTMAAEQVFTEAARELAKDTPAAAPMPAAETTETLTKRLREIEKSRNHVVALAHVLEARREDAKEAKKDYDNAVESFLTLVGRMTAVETPLPLFTAEAEQAAQGAVIDAEVPSDEELAQLEKWLADAGVSIQRATLVTWTPEQRTEALEWARREGNVESMPDYVAEAATAPADAAAEELFTSEGAPAIEDAATTTA